MTTLSAEKRNALAFAKIALALLSVAALAFLAYGCWRDPYSFAGMWGRLALFFVLPCALLFGGLLWFGRRLVRTGRRGGRVLAGIGTAGFVLVAAFLVWFGAVAGPWYDGVIAQGTAPDGREYVVTQAWYDWYDGYDVRLFHRQENGTWHSWWGGHFWGPFDHVDGIRLDGPDGRPVLLRARGRVHGGEWSFQSGHTNDHPADLAPADLLAFHQKEMRDLRTAAALAPHAEEPAK